MTISTTSRLAGPFAGNGATTAFAFTHKVFAASDVSVLRTTAGVTTALTLNVDYTVALNSNQEVSPGGTVTLTVALATGSTLLIGSQIPATQTLDLTNTGGFYPEVVEQALDRVVALVQQLAEASTRSLKAPVGSSLNDVPSAAARADLLLGFDSTGQPRTYQVAAGSNITITNTGGVITISSTASGGGAGNVTSVNASGGTTGLSFTGGPVTGAGTLTLTGTLAITNGGTGQTTRQGALNALAGATTANQVLKGDGTNITLSALTAADIPTLNQNTTGTAANVTGTVAIANGGTGQTTRQAALNALAGATTANMVLKGDGTNITLAALVAADIPVLNQNTTGTAANVTGTVAIANGGTGATSAQNARLALLPSITSQANKVLAVNAGATDVAWVTISGSGTVTSVDVSGGTTGLTASGGPITGSGTISLGGTLNIANGGTGATTAQGGRLALLPSITGNANKVLAVNAGATDVSWVTVSGTGTVTSVDASGGTTGLSFSGGPITGSGTLTLSGTLNVANGGTGAATFTAGRLLVGQGTGAFTSSIIADDGTTATVNGALTTNAAITSNTTTQAIQFGVGQTTGAITLGGTAGTGAITVGQSTGNQTVNVASGAVASGSTKTLNLGTGGVSGSTTTITIGSANGTSTTLNGALTVSGGLLTASNSLSVSGSITNSGAVTFNSLTSALNLGTQLTTGTWTAGGASQTSAITLGQSTDNQTVNVHSAATASTKTKTLNLGTGGLSGSTTAISIGSANTGGAGAGGNTTVQVNGAAFTPAIALTIAAATTINCALGNVFRGTMGANITTLTVSNPQDGQTINVRLIQDATGSRTITWPSSFKWAGGSAPALSTAANSVDLLVATYYADTGFWYASLLKAFA